MQHNLNFMLSPDHCGWQDRWIKYLKFNQESCTASFQWGLAVWMAPFPFLTSWSILQHWTSF